MNSLVHWAIFFNNQSNKKGLLKSLMSYNGPKPEGFGELEGKRGALFSKLELDKFIDEEVVHDKKLLTKDTDQSLQTYSSGERKKALFNYLLRKKPAYLVLDNPFDSLDVDSREKLQGTLLELSAELNIISLVSRQTDVLPFTTRYAVLMGDKLTFYNNVKETRAEIGGYKAEFKGSIPPPLEPMDYEQDYLIQLRNISVSYRDKPVLHSINWDIKPGEFWQLAGRNGSGKTTILSMITGDNPKAYGQELFLFGRKKGSGESIWEIKHKIGYFTPAMVDRFRGYHSLENMLISGLMDSIGLYIIPTEAQKRLAGQWLALVGMEQQKDRYFHDMTLGEQRLIMCIRAMIKHPLLLILDEPTVGLDDESASLVVALANKMAAESDTTIVFVSHRNEPDLQPEYIFQLSEGSKGSTGSVLKK